MIKGGYGIIKLGQAIKKFTLLKAMGRVAETETTVSKPVAEVVEVIERPELTGSIPLEGAEVINSKGVAYPKIIVEGYGEVPFPTGQISKVTPSPPDLRTAFDKIRNSGEFKAWWEGQGRPWPTATQGSRIDIHHIQPLGQGGTNAFENLVPLDYVTQYKQFNSWWLGYK